MKIEPKGKIPPSIIITSGSMNHFFSGIGRGTAFTRQGASGVPARFRPKMVPTSVNGSITNMQIHVTATCIHIMDHVLMSFIMHAKHNQTFEQLQTMDPNGIALLA
jgi:hypothetical protein